MREEIVMELSSKFYIIALSVVVILTLLSVLGIVILGRGHPESRLNRNFSKIMIAVVAVGALSAGFLAFKVWDSREVKKVDTGTDDVSQEEVFNYDLYVNLNQHTLYVDLLYGEEFVPEYDSSQLTLVTEDFEFTGLAGEQKVPLVFKDKFDKTHTLEYTVNVVDNNAPKLEGVVDIHLDYGRMFTEDMINIKATDPVDGELPVKLVGAVDESKPGIYKVTASAEDKNRNVTEEEFYVIVGGKDDPVGKPADEQSQPAPSDEELTEVAKKVINGEYGSGVKMQYALAREGYNFLEVEREVEKLKKSGYKPDKQDSEEGTTSAGVKVTGVYKESEKVEITNEGSEEVDISLWTLVSQKGNKKYLFPYGVKIPPKGMITVSSGANASGDYIMAKETVWNIDEENRVILLNRSNQEISNQKVEGKAVAGETIKPDDNEEPKEQPTEEGKLSVEEVAKQVIKGQFGNGAARRANLKAAGYDYDTVQAQVNKILLGN